MRIRQETEIMESGVDVSVENIRWAWWWGYGRLRVLRQQPDRILWIRQICNRLGCGNRHACASFQRTCRSCDNSQVDLLFAIEWRSSLYLLDINDLHTKNYCNWIY